MAKCNHSEGEYAAEIVYDENGKPKYQHYRCNGCDIILRTANL